MAKNETKRLRPIVLQADQDALTTAQHLGDYKPSNPAYTPDKLGAALSAMQSAQRAELNATNTLASAHDAAVAAEWAFHNAILGLKTQVVAQYGNDSDQAQSLGLKKKSEHKSPVRKKAKA